VALSEGLDRTIAFFQEQLNGAREAASTES
jgi:hypothetical protein